MSRLVAIILADITLIILLIQITVNIAIPSVLVKS